MNERMLTRVAVAAITGLGASSCTGSSGTQSCVGDTCMPQSCSNGVKDNQETDVDCGGPTCGKCAGARTCVTGDDCFSANCVASTGTCFSLAAVSFADPVAYDSGLKTYVMLSGDLDGDGMIDLAAANEEADAVAVFRNTGAGMFAAVTAPTQDGFPTGQYPTGGAISDFNADGVADIITADYHGNSVTILLGAGSGASYTLKAPASYPTVAGAETSELAVGDLNGDHIPDVMAANPQASSVSVFLGKPDGTLAPANNLAMTVPGSTDPAEPYSVAIGDFDGDGINDAAIADNRSGTMVIVLGNGDGTFRPGPTQPRINASGGYRMLTYDMNRDGHLDLVTIASGSDDVSVLLGTGDGGFRDGVASTTGMGTGPFTLSVADFNLDGVPDVVTANYMTSTASVLLGIGDGRFEAPIDAGMMGSYPYGVTAADFNGDGKPDFATANAVSNDVTVRMSTAH